MTEAIGFAGMVETPVVVVDSQKTAKHRTSRQDRAGRHVLRDACFAGRIPEDSGRAQKRGGMF